MRLWLLMFALFLSVLIHGAQGIRLRKSSVAAGRQQSFYEQFPGKRSDIEGVEEADICKSKRCSGKQKRKSSRVRKEIHHWIPRIHEDYYGPRVHRPKHH